MRVVQLDGGEGVGDFRGEKIAMLVADVGGRALQVNVSPATLLETVRFLQARIGRWRSRFLVLSESSPRKQYGGSNYTSHGK